MEFFNEIITTFSSPAQTGRTWFVFSIPFALLYRKLPTAAELLAVVTHWIPISPAYSDVLGYILCRKLQIYYKSTRYTDISISMPIDISNFFSIYRPEKIPSFYRPQKVWPWLSLLIFLFFYFFNAQLKRPESF